MVYYLDRAVSLLEEIRTTQDLCLGRGVWLTFRQTNESAVIFANYIIKVRTLGCQHILGRPISHILSSSTVDRQTSKCRFDHHRRLPLVVTNFNAFCSHDSLCIGLTVQDFEKLSSDQ